MELAASTSLLFVVSIKQDREKTIHFQLSELINVFYLCFKVIFLVFCIPIKCFDCLQLKSRDIVYFDNTRFKNKCSPRSEQYYFKEK